MSNYPLSICIPSNREHSTSRATISAALNFCDLSKSELVVSDNSDDIKKSSFWNSIKLDFFNYEKNAPLDSNKNWYNAIKKSNGLYTGILSDDDLILNIDEPVIDYLDIYKNNIFGIKPIIQLWNKKVGTYTTNNFSISDDTAIKRVHTYLTKANGNNTTLYSFYKKNIYHDLMQLSLEHPTRGGYADWAFVAGLVSSGKILLDPSKLLLYKNTNWFGNQEYINEQDENLYKKCGLSKRGSLFSGIFRAIDSFIYITRKSSPVDRNELIEAGKYILQLNINRFIQTYRKDPFKFSEKESRAIDKLEDCNNLNNYLDVSLEVIEAFNKDLVSKYLNFYEKSIEKEWGIID